MKRKIFVAITCLIVFLGSAGVAFAYKYVNRNQTVDAIQDEPNQQVLDIEKNILQLRAELQDKQLKLVNIKNLYPELPIEKVTEVRYGYIRNVFAVAGVWYMDVDYIDTVQTPQGCREKNDNPKNRVFKIASNIHVEFLLSNYGKDYETRPTKKVPALLENLANPSIGRAPFQTLVYRLKIVNGIVTEAINGGPCD